MNGLRVQRSDVSTFAGAGVPTSSTDVDRPGESAQLDLAERLGVGALGEPFELHRRDQHLDALGEVAQPGGHVDGRADVVVALEQQRVAGRQAGPDGQRRTDVGGPLLEVEDELDGVALVDGHDHAAVTEPLGDAHAAIGGDRAHDAAERAEDTARGIVAEGSGVVRESGQVDEHERAGDTHEVDDIGSERRRGGRPVKFRSWRNGSCTPGGTARRPDSSSMPTRPSTS